MRRTKEEALQTRDRVLMSALDIFSSSSYSDVSLTQIAEAVNMSKGAVYWHFKNKADLLQQLLDEIDTRSKTELRATLESVKKAEDVRAYYKEYVTYEPEQEEEFWYKASKLMLRREEWPADIRDNLRQGFSVRIKTETELVERLLRDGQERGEIRKDVDPKEAAGSIVEVFNGLLGLRFVGTISEVSEHRIDFIFDMFCERILVKR